VLVFVFRKNPGATATEQKRDRGSVPGVILQGFSYAIVWAIHRPFFSSLTAGNRPLELALAIVTTSIAMVSVLLVVAAVRTLGKEWSVTARVLEQHELATSGPYKFVRHPIYTGMLGMLIATGLAVSYPASLFAAIAVFMVGTIIRVRS